ncbi:MAG TPA: DNA-protecting protein DprA [Anaerolineae bacterium]|nr:DNA-protecting protein DprA [Anaerolineae bacterium]
MDSRIYWVGFNKVRGIGPVRFQKLLNHFSDLKRAWHAPLNELRSVGLSEKTLTGLQSLRNSIDLKEEYEKIAKKGIQVIIWEDENYPLRLKEIQYPPPVLYVRGEIDPRDEWAVAIVGTRQKTSYGRQVTQELASFLVQNGMTIISGLARGIDSIAHEAALRANGRTIAVLGSGVDQVYPPEHRSLAMKIIENGALISEYAPGTLPEGINFPPRNRIISGLSLAIIVVEAGIKSGALITAAFAADQGREVFAVPGTIYSPKSKGTNRLIVDGAHPLIRFKDILEILNFEQVQEFRVAQKILPSNEVELALLESISNEPMYIDDILSKTGLPIEEVSAALVMMELKGLVRQVGSQTYLAIREEEADYRKG